MAKRFQFSIGKITRPDANPDEVENVGAIGNVIHSPINQERREELKALMTSNISSDTANLKKDDKNLQAFEKILPAQFERMIDRKMLRPAPPEWNFFGRPSPDQYALIFQSIYKYGLWHPITVWEQEDGHYMILGGHTRDLVYDELYQMTGEETYLKIPCKVYKHDQISDITARRIVILSNIAQRAQENPKLRIRCYCEMVRLEKLEAFYGSGIDTNAAVAKLFGVSRATVFFYRGLEKLLDVFVDALEKNKISRQAATVIGGLPKELQQHIWDKGYYLNLTNPILKKLKNINSISAVDQLFQNPEEPNSNSKGKYRYTFFTDIEKPNGYDALTLYVNHNDMEKFQEFLKIFLNKTNTISAGTKKIILKMLQSKKV